MFEDGTQCPVCHVAEDPFADHHVGCGGNGDRIFRHNALRYAVFSAAQSVALTPRREVPSLIPSSRSRPVDIFLHSWELGARTIFSFGCDYHSTMQPTTINGAASTQGHVLLVGEARKLSTHEAACTVVGVSFVPIVMESFWWDECPSCEYSCRHRSSPRSTIGDCNS